jgi:hypothetical protein
MPNGLVCAMQYELGEYEVGNIQCFDREGVAIYLSTRTGDFQHVQDFYADIYDPVDKRDYVIEWADPESEYTFNDLMYGSED